MGEEELVSRPHCNRHARWLTCLPEGVTRLKIYVYGAGKVGVALARAWRAAGHEVTLRSARRGAPRASATLRALDALVLAVRDRDLAAAALAWVPLIGGHACAFHCAGAQPADAIGPLRLACRGIAQFHPMISFASKAKPPTLTRGQCHVRGDRAAERVGYTLAKAAKLTPRTIPALDPVAYHCAAALVANGAAALAAIGVEVLVAAGVQPSVAPRMLGPLLRSVAENIEALGFPAALTGPVRRGDAPAVGRHADLIGKLAPAALELYFAASAAQIPLARALGEAAPSAFDAVAEMLATKRAANKKRGSRV
jgi:predicted short-subunit dehydrogenase-like oxidoreductase (DUF2520 family)